MNWRNFIKFLGKATVASRVVVVSGLPELVDDPVEFEDIEPYVRGCNSGSMHGGTTPKKIAKWNSDAWTMLPEWNGNAWQLPRVASDDVIYIGAEDVEV